MIKRELLSTLAHLGLGLQNITKNVEDLHLSDFLITLRFRKLEYKIRKNQTWGPYFLIRNFLTGNKKLSVYKVKKITKIITYTRPYKGPYKRTAFSSYKRTHLSFLL